MFGAELDAAGHRRVDSCRARGARIMNLVQTILREREVLNERRVAVARLALVSGAVALDLLAYAGWVQTTLTPPSGPTMKCSGSGPGAASAASRVARLSKSGVPSSLVRPSTRLARFTASPIAV